MIVLISVLIITIFAAVFSGVNCVYIIQNDEDDGVDPNHIFAFILAIIIFIGVAILIPSIRQLFNQSNCFVVQKIEYIDDSYKFSNFDNKFVYRKTKEFNINDTLWIKK